MVHITFNPTFPAVFTLILDKLNNCPKFPIGDLRITGELFIKYPIPHLGAFKIADFNNHKAICEYTSLSYQVLHRSEPYKEIPNRTFHRIRYDPSPDRQG